MRDVAWGVVAAAVTAVALFNVVAGLALLVADQQWSVLLRLPVTLLFWYWLGLGAWRRTRWGRPVAD